MARAFNDAAEDAGIDRVIRTLFSVADDCCPEHRAGVLAAAALAERLKNSEMEKRFTAQEAQR